MTAVERAISEVHKFFTLAGSPPFCKVIVLAGSDSLFGLNKDKIR